MPPRINTEEMLKEKATRRIARRAQTAKAMENAVCVIPIPSTACTKACNEGRCPVGGSIDRCVSTNRSQ